jgi:hypothetical protein
MTVIGTRGNGKVSAGNKENYPVAQIAYEDALAYAQWDGQGVCSPRQNGNK